MNIISLLIAVIVQPLWPEGKVPYFQEHQIAVPSQQAKAADFKASEHRMPYLEWEESPANANGAVMLLLSGGGYNNTCDGPAFKPLAAQLASNGVTCVWLWYRTPRPKGLEYFRTAWADGQRAVRLVRSQAAAKGLDPKRIGVMGMSAGGHLTVLLATSSMTPAYERVDELDDLPCNVNWAIAQSPAYLLTDGLGRANTRDGDAPDVKLDSCFKFDAQTCPMCMMHGGNDVYSPNGSTQVYRQLRRMKIPAELHLDADRPHCVLKPAKFERGLEFMRQMGFLGPLAAEVALLDRFASDDDQAIVEKQLVWPEGKTPDVQTNQCVPYIEWHLPKVLKTKAIQIAYSGGSYNHNGPESFEVAPIRRYLNAKGMTVVTMKYRVPRPAAPLQKHVTAWQDLQRAIRLVRSQAAAKGLDPERIGIMGESAGGHLTLMGATSSKHKAYWPIDEIDKTVPCNVQWAIAIYPAYSLTDGGEKPNAQGGNEDDSRLVPEFSFDLATCPILFLHGDNDGWAAMNSVKCWEQLRRMGIQGELHTYATRNHCFHRKASPGTGSYTYDDRIWDFMTQKGFNK